MTVKRPAIVDDVHLKFLDSFRETGVINMHGASSYLYQTFPLMSKQEAVVIVQYWMDSFEERMPEGA